MTGYRPERSPGVECSIRSTRAHSAAQQSRRAGEHHEQQDTGCRLASQFHRKSPFPKRRRLNDGRCSAGGTIEDAENQWTPTGRKTEPLIQQGSQTAQPFRGSPSDRSLGNACLPPDFHRGKAFEKSPDDRRSIGLVQARHQLRDHSMQLQTLPGFLCGLVSAGCENVRRFLSRLTPPLCAPLSMEGVPQHAHQPWPGRPVGCRRHTKGRKAGLLNGVVGVAFVTRQTHGQSLQPAELAEEMLHVVGQVAGWHSYPE
jgi:hypothetical protein